MKINWSEPALADLEAIYDFIARDSPHYAARFVRRLLEAIERLASLPMMGRIVLEGDGRHREVFEPPYRIVYLDAAPTPRTVRPREMAAVA